MGKGKRGMMDAEIDSMKWVFFIACAVGLVIASLLPANGYQNDDTCKAAVATTDVADNIELGQITTEGSGVCVIKLLAPGNYQFTVSYTEKEQD